MIVTSNACIKRLSFLGILHFGVLPKQPSGHVSLFKLSPKTFLRLSSAGFFCQVVYNSAAMSVCGPGLDPWSARPLTGLVFVVLQLLNVVLLVSHVLVLSIVAGLWNTLIKSFEYGHSYYWKNLPFWGSRYNDTLTGDLWQFYVAKFKELFCSCSRTQ